LASKSRDSLYLIDSTIVKAHRAASGAKRMARPVVKWSFRLASTICENVSGLSAAPLAKMEIRASWSS
jgi:hypothetical protein